MLKACGIGETTSGNDMRLQTTLSNKTMKQLGQEVAQAVKARGGRFLRRIVQSDKKYVYEEVEDSVAQEKAKQTFRH